MARIIKHKSAGEVAGVIKHNIREFRNGVCPTNLEVDPDRSKDNYSIIRRGNTAKEILAYKQDIDKEVFRYNRKGIVLANEVVITLPKDCPPEQERAFFEEAVKYVASTILMGERAIFLAEVHADEGQVKRDGQVIAEGNKHIHIMYVPAVADTKHDGYKYRLCSDELTRRQKLKEFHPNFQTWLDEAGIKATVSSGVTTGSDISVKSMKELSKITGLNLEQIQKITKENQMLREQLAAKEKELAVVQEQIRTKPI